VPAATVVVTFMIVVLISAMLVLPAATLVLTFIPAAIKIPQLTRPPASLCKMNGLPTMSVAELRIMNAKLAPPILFVEVY